MDDLTRYVEKRHAVARCDQCIFSAGYIARDITPAQAGARARQHTRSTGHRTRVKVQHITTYEPPRKTTTTTEDPK